MRTTALLAIAARTACAQARPVRSARRTVYRDIDQLTAAGLIDTIVSGTRPYSAREVARLLSDAKRNLGRLRSGAGWEDEIISADLERYAPHANRAIDEARVDAAVMSSPTRAVPTDANGSLDATINPLAAYRGGVPLANGSTTALETERGSTVGPYLAVAFTPRFTSERSPVTAARALPVQSASVSALLGNVRSTWSNVGHVRTSADGRTSALG